MKTINHLLDDIGKLDELTDTDLVKQTSPAHSYTSFRPPISGTRETFSFALVHCPFPYMASRIMSINGWRRTNLTSEIAIGIHESHEAS